ncbi:MAG TPA: 3-deoxy-D-manno-octulosonic acid transferase, partial [Terriglobales bacterium]|nr:3-deoxy-D-manno-octulosonic acid transferase [Terriglobales bacterium]
ARLRLGGERDCIWIHAVSVGEVLAVAGLVQQIRRQFPDRRVFISTTTTTGQKLASSKFGAENVFYFPLDFAFAIRAWLRALQPALVVVAETEFWPNFLRLAKSSGATIAVVNARISDRSLPRYLYLRAIFRRVLRHVDLFLAQSDEDLRRLLAIGAEPSRVKVSGNLKFDIAPPAHPPDIVGWLRSAMIAGGAGPVIVAGSTVEGEEVQVVDAFGTVFERTANAVLVLAPRHPERFAAVADIVSGSRLPFWRRSQWNDQQAIGGGVFLLDSIGELGAIYSLADIAFVGGSLAKRGGHNILEPASYGVPVIVGPHTENFRDIVEIFRRAAAVTLVHSELELRAEFVALLADGAKRRELGERAAALVTQQAGTTARTLAELETLLASSHSRSRRRRQ